MKKSKNANNDILQEDSDAALNSQTLESAESASAPDTLGGVSPSLQKSERSVDIDGGVAETNSKVGEVVRANARRKKSGKNSSEREDIDLRELVDKDGTTDVNQTFSELKQEGSADARKKHKWYVVLLGVLLFPITICVLLFKKLATKYKMSIVGKCIFVFTIVFVILIVSYVVFMISSVGRQISGMPGAEAFMFRLKLTSVVLVIVFAVIAAAVSFLSSLTVMRPISRMTEQVKTISSENLSMRLDPTESQDELRDLTLQINSMLESLEESFERQANFVSDASHELKTPLSVIIGNANLIKRWGKDDPAIMNESIDVIAREAANMKKIVDQLLWLAKLGKFTASKTDLNLCELVLDVVDSYKIIDTERDMTFDGAEVWVSSDRALVTEALRALIDNAIKYTTPVTGRVDVGLMALDGKACITVTDNGAGISSENQKKVFDRFFRVDKTRGRESGSSGLGLTITKTIIEMLGGTIELESELGVGSRFTISLPLITR